MQIWDADLVSADDYLGSKVLDLNKFPRPVKDSKRCTMDRFKHGRVPVMNLFKNTHCRGWWPMVANNNGDVKLVVCIDEELTSLAHIQIAEDF